MKGKILVVLSITFVVLFLCATGSGILSVWNMVNEMQPSTVKISSVLVFILIFLGLLRIIFKKSSTETFYVNTVIVILSMISIPIAALVTMYILNDFSFTYVNINARYDLSSNSLFTVHNLKLLIISYIFYLQLVVNSWYFIQECVLPLKNKCNHKFK